MKLLIALLLLAGCSNYDNAKCVNGKTAYRSGDAWVIPPTAYDCVPAAYKEEEK